MRYFKIIILAALAFSALAVAAESKEFDATISWRPEGITEGDHGIRSGLPVPIFRYYWNDQFVGAERDGLAEIYDRLENFKGKSVLFIARPRKEKDPRFIEGDDYFISPLEKYDAFHHIYTLLRKKNLRFTIEFQDRVGEPKIGLPGSNPFRESPNGTTEQAGADQPATAPKSKSEGKGKPQPESNPAPR